MDTCGFKTDTDTDTATATAVDECGRTDAWTAPTYTFPDCLLNTPQSNEHP